jgi:hypothetical protein
VWFAYCSTIIVLFGTIKCINHALHCVYDTTECLEEPNQNISQQKLESEKKRDTRTKRREQPQDQDFVGIELQVLNGLYWILDYYIYRILFLIYYLLFIIYL